MNGKDYKRLGDYISPTMERNEGLKVKLSQGINNNKYFQTPRQVAQDSENDQIVRKGQFAYNKATTRNGEKISIAYREGEDCTVSSAYQVFYINDEKQLNPHYLMMWFKRPEFDRYARFKSHGSAHEFFTWEEMCNVMLPVPSIEEQSRIVTEYQAVERRIANNEKLIQKLEETAQTIYHNMFVDGIDEENLPNEWRKGTLGDITNIVMGQSPDGDSFNKEGFGEIFYQGRTDFGFRIPSVRVYTTEPTRYANYKDILMSVRAPVGDLNVAPFRCCIGRGLAAICEKGRRNSFVFYTLLNKKDAFKVSDDAGTIFGSINKEELYNLEIIIPEDGLITKFDNECNKLDNLVENVEKENNALLQLKSLLTSKLA